MIRRHVVVRGRVQGVFFRASCEQQTHGRAIGGWVTNRADGAVEAVFEGAEVDVEALVEWCRHGPERAEVESVDVMPEQPQGEPDFTIR